MAGRGTEASVSAISLHDAVKSSENAQDVQKEEKPKRIVLKDPTAPDFENKKKKKPRRVLHFSDGILEEYSETEDEDEVDNTPQVDPKKLTWAPWFLHYFTKSAKGTLSAADYIGENLAWFLGITSPKYQHAIDEYKRMKKQEQEDKEREEREKEFQRQRRLEGGPDLEGGVLTYSNKAFGLEIDENETSHQPPIITSSVTKEKPSPDYATTRF